MNENYKWLTNEFAINLIKYAFNDENVQINSINVETFLAPGSNFASDVIRLTIEFTGKAKTTQNSQFILKTTNSGDDHIQGQQFNREVQFGQKIVPQLGKILKLLDSKEALAIYPQFVF